MAEKNVNHVIVLEPVADSANELLTMLREKNGAEIINAANAAEAAQILNQYAPCMLICSLKETPNIPVVVSLLKTVEKSIKQGFIKTLVISKIPAPQLASLISGLGVSDYILEPFPARTLYFKSNLQLKAIESIKKTQAAKKASEEKVVFKTSGEAGNQEAQKLKEGAVTSKQSAALNVAEDTFLFKKGSAKKTGKKVMLEMDGPPPETGEWVQHSDPGDPETRWRWVDEDEKDTEASKSGDGWVHSGEKPTYNDTTKKWQMNSENPNLSLYKNKTKVASKVKINEAGELEVAEDSEAAEEKVNKLKLKAEKKKEAAQLVTDQANKAEKDKIDATRLAAANKLEAAKSAVAEKIAAAKEKKDAPKLKAGKAEEKSEAERTKLQKLLPIKKNRLDELKQKMLSTELTQDEQAEVQEIEQLLSENAEIVAALTPETTEDDGGETVAKRAELAKLQKEKKPAKKVSPLDFLKNKKALLENSDSELNSDDTSLPETNISLTPDEELIGAIDKRGAGDEDAPPEVFGDASSPGGENDAPKVNGRGVSTLKQKAAPGVRANWSQKQKAAMAEKEALMRRLEQELNGPIADNLSDEEEAALRAELGDKDRKELTKEALLRKKKAKDIKSLRENLAKMENEFDATPSVDSSEHAHNAHDLNQEAPEDTWGNTQAVDGEIERTKLRAFDSDLSEEELKKQRDRLHKETKEKEKRQIEMEEHYLYKEEEEITPVGGVWEKADDYYVFLDGNIRYKGFKNISDIMPLWIFSGEKIPEFIGKNKQWRFWKIDPVKCITESELPIVVHDYLLSLQREEKLKPKSAAANALEALKNRLGDSSNLSEEENLARELNGEDTDSESTPSLADSSDEINSEIKSAAKKKKDKADQSIDSSDLGQDKKEASDEEQEDLSLKRARNGEENNDRLHDDLAKELAENKANKKKSSVEDFLASRQSKLQEMEEAPSARSSIPKVLIEEDSESIKAFLERRKNKGTNKPEPKALAKEKNPYLAIYVAFSDAFRMVNKWEILAPHLLATIAGSIDSCEPFILEPFPTSEAVKILVSGSESRASGTTIVPEGGFKKEISIPVGTEKKLLGYFYVMPTQTRKTFNEVELSAFEKVTRLLASLMNKEINLNKKRAA